MMMGDIWTIEQWDCLKLAFPKDKTESKILLTTRNKKVASHPDRNCFVLDLRCISNRESWDWFEAYFGRNFTSNNLLSLVQKTNYENSISFIWSIIIYYYAYVNCPFFFLTEA